MVVRVTIENVSLCQSAFLVYDKNTIQIFVPVR